MLKLSANISIMFTEVPFLDRFALAAKHGFKGVEFWFPYEHSKEDVAARINDNGLTCIGLNTAPGDTSRGDWGLAIFKDRRADFLAGIDQAINYATALRCANIHVMAGMMPVGCDAAACESIYVESISLAGERARVAGKNVLIEPLNPIDRPGYFLSTQSQARRVVNAIDADNVKIMFDVYHVQMTEGNIVATFKKNLAKIGHVQIADVPGRHEPGTGEINFAFVLDEIAASGYGSEGNEAGWVGCEYKPKTETAGGLSWRNAHQLFGQRPI
jgi:hydroxypyruvate isomerase